MANVPNLVYNSPYLSSLGVQLAIPNAGARLRRLLMNPFYVTPASFLSSVGRPIMGQIWPRGIGVTQIINMATALGVQVYRTGDLVITNGALTVVTFNAEAVDDNNFWAVGQPTRLTITTPGWYAMIAQGVIDASAGAGTGIFSVSIRKDGTTILGRQDKFLTPTTLYVLASTLLKFDGSGYIEMLVQATLSGPDLTIKGGATGTFLQLIKVP